MPKIDHVHRNFRPHELWTPIYFRDIHSSLSSLLLGPPSLKKEFATPISNWVTNDAQYTLCHAHTFLESECPTILEKINIEKIILIV